MYELTLRSLLAPVATCRAPRLGRSPAAGGCPDARRRASCNSVRCRRRFPAAVSALDGGREAATAPVQPLHSAAQLRKATAVLQNAITTAVVDFSRRDEPQASASTQFVIVTEQMPLDRAAAEGWLDKLVCCTRVLLSSSGITLRGLRALRTPQMCCVADTAGIDAIMDTAVDDMTQALILEPSAVILSRAESAHRCCTGAAGRAG